MSVDAVRADLQLLGGIWIEARGGSLIAISSQRMKRELKGGFEVRCGCLPSSLRHHDVRQATITIVYELHDQR
jgi:hypothetical protein